MTDTIQKFIHARVNDYIHKRNEQKENLILEYLIGNPDLSINDIELVEQRFGDDIIWYCRKKGSEE